VASLDRSLVKRSGASYLNNFNCPSYTFPAGCGSSYLLGNVPKPVELSSFLINIGSKKKLPNTNTNILYCCTTFFMKALNN
jgi:hypothetical protein